MKQTLIILTIFALSSFKPFQSNGLTKKEAQTLVTNFMASMKNILFEKQDVLEKYISPKEINNYKDNSQYQGINTYVIGNFKITKIELPFVTVKIKHIKAENQKKSNWVKELTFKIELYQGQAYIVPSGSTDNYVNPWWTKKEK